MKKFIKNIFLFVSPILLLGYFLDFFISNQLKNSNSYAEKEYSTWNDVFDGKINSDIVIYGSSRAWVHYDASLMSDSLHCLVYNLGIDGHNFWLQYLRHKEFLKNNKKPKLIILSLDYFTFKKNTELYNSEQFLPYMLWNNDIENATLSYKGFTKVDYNFPLIRYYGKYDAVKTSFGLFSGIIKNPVTRVKGYMGRVEKWNGDFDKAKAKMKKMEIQIDRASVNLFKSFINECNQKNIKIVFVYSPEYIEGQPFVKNRNQIFKLYKDLSILYNIPFYNFSNDSLCFQKKYFYNTEHLNKDGSRIFTLKLIDTLKTKYNISYLLK